MSARSSTCLEAAVPLFANAPGAVRPWDVLPGAGAGLLALHKAAMQFSAVRAHEAAYHCRSSACRYPSKASMRYN